LSILGTLFPGVHELPYKQVLNCAQDDLACFEAWPVFKVSHTTSDEELEAHLIEVMLEKMQSDFRERAPAERQATAEAYDEELAKRGVDTTTREAVIQSIIDPETSTGMNTRNASAAAQWLFYEGVCGSLRHELFESENPLLALRDVAGKVLTQGLRWTKDSVPPKRMKTIPACLLLAAIHARHRVESKPVKNVARITATSAASSEGRKRDEKRNRVLLSLGQDKYHLSRAEAEALAEGLRDVLSATHKDESEG
jgi:hypothetical protein